MALQPISTHRPSAGYRLSFRKSVHLCVWFEYFSHRQWRAGTKCYITQHRPVVCMIFMFIMFIYLFSQILLAHYQTGVGLFWLDVPIIPNLPIILQLVFIWMPLQLGTHCGVWAGGRDSQWLDNGYKLDLIPAGNQNTSDWERQLRVAGTVNELNYVSDTQFVVKSWLCRSWTDPSSEDRTESWTETQTAAFIFPVNRNAHVEVNRQNPGTPPQIAQLVN